MMVLKIFSLIFFAGILILSVAVGGISVFRFAKKDSGGKGEDKNIVCRGGENSFATGIILFVLCAAMSSAELCLVFTGNVQVALIFCIPCALPFAVGFYYILPVFYSCSWGEKIEIRKPFRKKEIYEPEEITLAAIRLKLFQRARSWKDEVYREEISIFAGEKRIFKADEDYIGYASLKKMLLKKRPCGRLENWRDDFGERKKERLRKSARQRRWKLRVESHKRFVKKLKNLFCGKKENGASGKK